MNIKDFIKETGLDDVGFKTTAELIRRVFKKEDLRCYVKSISRKVNLSELAEGLKKLDDNFHSHREATITFLKSLEMSLDNKQEQAETLIVNILIGIQKVVNRAEIQEEELQNQIAFLEKFILKQEKKELELIKRLPKTKEDKEEKEEKEEKEDKEEDDSEV